MTPLLSFFVVGIPAPGGSKKFVGMRKGKPLLVDDCKRNPAWRSAVTWHALAAKLGWQIEHSKDWPLLTIPLSISMEFVLPRPKIHFFKTGNLKPEFLNAIHSIRPDLTKFVRSTEDALTGCLFRDDGQIIEQRNTKRYQRAGEQTGAQITISI